MTKADGLFQSGLISQYDFASLLHRTVVDVLDGTVQFHDVPVILEPQSKSLEQLAILAQLRSALPALRSKYGVAGLSVFGSVVRDEMDGASDVDLLVEFERVPGFFKFVELEDELSGLLQRKVDLVMRQALRPRIGRRVLAEAVPV